MHTHSSDIVSSVKMAHSVQRHFPPPTLQCRFSPERVIDPPVFAYKMTFSSEGPLTALDFSSSAAGDPDTHGNGNPSAPQGMSSRLQKPKGEWNRPSKGYSLAKHCSEILGWGMGKFTETEVDHNQLFCMSLLTCFQSASFILWLMIIWITRCLEVHRISRRAVMSAMQYVFLHNYPNIMFSLNVR